MLIGLLGASGSGKTTYLTGVYLKYRNIVSFPGRSKRSPSPHAKEALSFRVTIRDFKIEKEFAARAEEMLRDPVIYPPGTTAPLSSFLDVSYVFKNIETNIYSRHDRNIAFFDSAGGSLSGESMYSQESISGLEQCDSFIVFLDAEVFIDASRLSSDDDDYQVYIGSKLAIGKIFELLDSVSNNQENNDTFPVCIVISKVDILNKTVIKDINQKVYDNVIIPISQERPNFMIAVCPTSVSSPETKLFKAHNLEWPFIFSSAGAIFRNSVLLASKASENDSLADKARARAHEVSSGGIWKKLIAFVDGTGVNDSLRRYENYRTEAGRMVGLSEDDRTLAMKLWRCLAIDGQLKGIRIFKEGLSLTENDVASL